MPREPGDKSSSKAERVASQAADAASNLKGAIGRTGKRLWDRARELGGPRRDDVTDAELVDEDGNPIEQEDPNLVGRLREATADASEILGAVTERVGRSIRKAAEDAKSTLDGVIESRRNRDDR